MFVHSSRICVFHWFSPSVLPCFGHPLTAAGGRNHRMWKTPFFKALFHSLHSVFHSLGWDFPGTGPSFPDTVKNCWFSPQTCYGPVEKSPGCVFPALHRSSKAPFLFLYFLTESRKFSYFSRSSGYCGQVLFYPHILWILWIIFRRIFPGSRCCTCAAVFRSFLSYFRLFTFL